MAQLILNKARDNNALLPWIRGMGGAKNINEPIDAYRVLGWNTTKEELVTTSGEKSGTWATIKHGAEGRVILGNKLGPGYGILQNVSMLNAVTQLHENGCQIKTVGEVDGGKKVWALCGMPGDLMVGKGDIMARYIMVWNDHCGHSKATVEYIITRLACLNGAAINQTEGRQKLRHTGDMDLKFDNVMATMAAADNQFLVYGAQMDTLTTRRNIVQADVTRYVRQVMFPNITDKEADEKRERIQTVTTEISRLFDSGPGAETVDAKGTPYGLYHAVNRWLNYDSKSSNRQASLVFGSNAAVDARALREALALVA